MLINANANLDSKINLKREMRYVRKYTHRLDSIVHWIHLCRRIQNHPHLKHICPYSDKGLVYMEWLDKNKYINH